MDHSKEHIPPPHKDHRMVHYVGSPVPNIKNLPGMTLDVDLTVTSNFLLLPAEHKRTNYNMLLMQHKVSGNYSNAQSLH